MLLKVPVNNCRYKNIFGSYYLGLFFNNLLPTGVGGDIIRILRLRKVGIDTNSLVSSTLIDRMIGLSSIIAMGMVAFMILPEVRIHINTAAVSFITIILGLACFLLFFSRKLSTYIIQFSKKYEHIKFFSLAFSAFKGMLVYQNSRTHILAAFSISLLAQHFVIFTYVMIGYSLNIDLSAAVYFSIVPIVFVTTALPISVGGLGVREATLVTLFVLFSGNMQSAIALSLMYFFIIVLLTAPAGFILITNPKNK